MIPVMAERMRRIPALLAQLLCGPRADVISFGKGKYFDGRMNMSLMNTNGLLSRQAESEDWSRNISLL